MAPRLLTILLVLLMPAPALAAGTVMLIDRSGSMKAYYASGLVHRLAASIAEGAATVETPSVVLFHTSTETLPSVQALAGATPSGNTLLADALNRHLTADRIWIVTDNVQDVGGAAETKHDMSSFYATLRDERVRHVYVFPLRQAPGTSGLLVYAIGTAADEEPLRRQIARFRELSTAQKVTLDEVLMKPLGDNAITIEILGDRAPLSFEEGEPLEISQQVSIGAKFPHLYFESSPAVVGTIQTPFQGNSCLVPDRGDGSITPNVVHTERTDTYHVKVDFGRIRLKKTPECILQAALGSASEVQQITTPIEIVVPQQNLRLSQGFLDQFSAETPAEAAATGRIFGIRNVPGFVAPRTVRVPINVPRQVKVSYPSWPALVVVGLLLAGLGGGTAGARPLVQWVKARLARVKAPSFAEEPNGSAPRPSPRMPPQPSSPKRIPTRR